MLSLLFRTKKDFDFLLQTGSALSFVQKIDDVISKKDSEYSELFQLDKSEGLLKLRFNIELFSKEDFQKIKNDWSLETCKKALIGMHLVPYAQRALERVANMVDYKVPYDLNQWDLWSLLDDYEYQIRADPSEPRVLNIVRFSHPESSLRTSYGRNYAAAVSSNHMFYFEGFAKSGLLGLFFFLPLSIYLIPVWSENGFDAMELLALFFIISFALIGSYKFIRYLFVVKKHRAAMDNFFIAVLDKLESM
jgi:hypothetical protein